MTVEIIEGRYFAAMWMIPFRDRSGDVNAAIWRDDGEKDFVGQFRLRVYVDDKAHDSEDRKTAWRTKFPGKTEAEATKIMGQMLDSVVDKIAPGSEVHKLVLRSSDPAFILERLKAEDWVHVQEIPVPLEEK